MSEWKEYKLGELCDLITDGKHGNCEDEINSGYYFISAKDIYNGRINYENARQIKKLDFEETHRRTNLKEGDLLITNSGTIGRIALALKEERTCRTTFQKSVAVLKPNKLLFSTFFYYLMLSNYSSLLNLGEGTTQQNLLLGELKNMKVSLPGLNEQKTIASVLSSLDDKIDLLHRQNKTLEAMAETLFRKWFVEDADESWEKGKLGNVIDLNYGKSLIAESRALGKSNFPVYGSGGIVGYHNEYLVKGPGIVIGRKGTLGNTYYVFNSFYPIDTTYYIKSKIDSVDLFYEYFLLKTLNFEDLNTDSAVPGLNKNMALSTEIRIPTVKRILKFNKHCLPFFSKIKLNINEIYNLENLRDTLLPKLMSGEIKINI